MRLEYHPSTASDLNRAIKFYDGQRPGLGAECRAAVYDAIDQIKNAPLRYRTITGDLRRIFVRDFPFSILYRVIDDELIRILVIRHHRQRSSFGQSRR